MKDTRARSVYSASAHTPAPSLLSLEVGSRPGPQEQRAGGVRILLLTCGTQEDPKRKRIVRDGAPDAPSRHVQSRVHGTSRPRRRGSLRLAVTLYRLALRAVLAICCLGGHIIRLHHLVRSAILAVHNQPLLILREGPMDRIKHIFSGGERTSVWVQEQRSHWPYLRKSQKISREEHEKIVSERDEARVQYERERQAGEKSRKERDTLNVRIQSLEARLADVSGEAARNASKLAELQREIAHYQKERSNTSALLETRTMELKEAQAFLPKADNVADKEVVRMVEQLNTRIFQTAAALAESPKFQYGMPGDIRAVEEVMQKHEKYDWLGPHLLPSLRSINHADDPLLVQTALQATMAGYAQRLATSWDLGRCDAEDLCSNIYTGIRETEPQSVAGKWRAMCRTNIKKLLDVEDTKPEKYQMQLAQVLAEVLVLCGVVSPLDAVRDVIDAGFRKKLKEIAELVLDIQRIMGEVVVSRELTITVATPNVSFEAATMDDEWADPKHPSTSGQVLCTTHLGLLREDLEGRTVKVIPLVKPKVVLRSMLEQLWAEMTSADQVERTITVPV